MKALCFALGLALFAPLTAAAAEEGGAGPAKSTVSGVKKAPKKKAADAEADEETEAPRPKKSGPRNAHQPKKGPQIKHARPASDEEGVNNGGGGKGQVKGIQKAGHGNKPKGAHGIDRPKANGPKKGGGKKGGPMGDLMPRKPTKDWKNGVFVQQTPKKAQADNEHRKGGSGHSNKGLDRDMSLAVGVKGGTAHEVEGQGADPGLGLVLRVRPVAAFGLEGAVTRYRGDFSALQSETATAWQASGQLFAFSWSHLSPYATLGYTSTTVVDPGTHALDDPATMVQRKGPHAGIGLEIALGERFAIDLDGRVIGYLDAQGDSGPRIGRAASIGALWYF